MLKQKKFNDLKEYSLPFEHSHHERVTTCEQSAQARKRDIAIGGKSLLFKSSRFGLALVSFSAVLKLNNNRVRKVLNSNKLRLATAEELEKHIGVPSGAVPPVGAPFYEIPHFVDLSLLRNDEIAFNPGVLTESLILKTEHYLRLIPHSIYCDMFPDL